jgi:peptide/nickel transport system ATP-binding protein
VTDTPPLLQVDDLATHFFTPSGVVHAVNGVSFVVGEGELVGIVGETGCGKSVTVRSIIGLVKPPGRIVGGSAKFGGADLLELSRRRLRRFRGTQISFIPQNPWGALNPILPIGRQMENVIRAHRRASGAECRKRSLEMLERVGISDPERVTRGYAHELSGGMAQRVVIAIALLLDPRLVIADEPTTGLDATIQRQILDLAMDLMAADNRSMLLVTHDLGVVAQYCRRVIVMYAGKVVESGPVDQIFGNPAHPYTRALLDAIPQPGKELVSLAGRVPNLIDYPTGCPFKARCHYAFGACDRETDLRPLDGQEGRLIACHLQGGVKTPVTPAH